LKGRYAKNQDEGQQGPRAGKRRETAVEGNARVERRNHASNIPRMSGAGKSGDSDF
jgi:hypothetical protein